jgi:hypothetical protein
MSSNSYSEGLVGGRAQPVGEPGVGWSDNWLKIRKLEN